MRPLAAWRIRPASPTVTSAFGWLISRTISAATCSGG